MADREPAVVQIVRDPTWQRLREQLAGTWGKPENVGPNLAKLRGFLGANPTLTKLRIVLNYLAALRGHSDPRIKRMREKVHAEVTRRRKEKTMKWTAEELLQKHELLHERYAQVEPTDDPAISLDREALSYYHHVVSRELVSRGYVGCVILDELQKSWSHPETTNEESDEYEEWIKAFEGDEKECAALSAATRNKLPNSAFGYIDPKGGRHFPLHDEAHVRAAVGMLAQSKLPRDILRRIARKVAARAKRYGIELSEKWKKRWLGQ